MQESKNPAGAATYGVEVFAEPLRTASTPSVLEIATMIKGGKPGDMDKLDV
jgi:hypothetical protein